MRAVRLILRRVGVAAALAAVCVVAGCAGIGDEKSGPDPGGNERASVTLPPHGKWFGFSGGFFEWTGRYPDLDQGATAQRTAADALAVGANSARLDVPWSDVEPAPGQVNQAYLQRIDAFVRAIEQGGGRVLIILGGTPNWAAARPGQGSPPRTDASTTAAYQRYVSLVTSRWPGALAFETWNEPNAARNWLPAPDPRAYTRLHKLATAVIRRNAPKARVLLGSLSISVEDGGQTMPVDRFLRAMYAAGLRPSDYDGLGLHPYPGQSGTMDSLEGGQFARSFADLRRGYRARDPNASLWITETGVTTTGPSPATPAGQAAGIVALTRKLLSNPQVKGVWLHTEYDFQAAAPTSPERGYGLISAHKGAADVPKPAYCALLKLARRPPRATLCGR